MSPGTVSEVRCYWLLEHRVRTELVCRPAHLQLCGFTYLNHSFHLQHGDGKAYLGCSCADWMQVGLRRAPWGLAPALTTPLTSPRNDV